MLFFQHYGALELWWAVLATVGVLLAGAALYYSIRAYPHADAGAAAESRSAEEDPHAEHDPGVPLILKWLYAGFFLWLVVFTYVVATGRWIV